VYCPESETLGIEEEFGRIAVGEMGGVLDGGETGRYCCGMWAFSNGNSPCNSVKSSVVEYLNHFHEKPPNQTWRGKSKGRTYPK
jgi:hypothetical protein